MNIELVTAAADAVAAIAVVVSLVYLGRQIHISNLQSQAAARYSFLDAYGAGNATIASSTEASSVFYRGLTECSPLPAEPTILSAMIRICRIRQVFNQEQTHHGIFLGCAPPKLCEA